MAVATRTRGEGAIQRPRRTLACLASLLLLCGGCNLFALPDTPPRLLLLLENGDIIAYDPATDSTETVVAGAELDRLPYSFYWDAQGALQLVLDPPRPPALPTPRLLCPPLYRQVSSTACTRISIPEHPGAIQVGRFCDRSDNCVVLPLELADACDDVARLTSRTCLEVTMEANYLLTRDGRVQRVPIPSRDSVHGVRGDGELATSPAFVAWEPSRGRVQLSPAHPMAGAWHGEVSVMDESAGATVVTRDLSLRISNNGYLVSINKAEVGGVPGDRFTYRSLESVRTTDAADLRVVSSESSDQDVTIALETCSTIRAGIAGGHIERASRRIDLHLADDRLRYSETRVVSVRIFPEDETTTHEVQVTGTLQRWPDNR